MHSLVAIIFLMLPYALVAAVVQAGGNPWGAAALGFIIGWFILRCFAD